MIVTLIHAYSSTNAGDGLLVDESLQLINESISPTEVNIIAIHPESFAGYSNVAHPIGGRNTRRVGITSYVRAAVSQKPHPTVQRMINRSDLVVAVGGGYLRAKNAIEYLKVLIAHRPQTPFGRNAKSFIYLPQSIGPLPPKFMPGFSRLSAARLIAVRDDRSLTELRVRGIEACRLPDLAALALLRSDRSHRRPPSLDPTVGVIARRLASRSRSRYTEAVKAMLALPQCEPLVQATGRGNNDIVFYENLGWPAPHRHVIDAIDRGGMDITISVRLHGSLQSIIHGCPSVHLGYERKGWGVYDDLGLIPYLRNAREVDGSEAVSLAKAIAADPSAFWASIDESLPKIQEKRDELIDAIRTAALK